jgi:hypothetical protein
MPGRHGSGPLGGRGGGGGFRPGGGGGFRPGGGFGGGFGGGWGGGYRRGWGGGWGPMFGGGWGWGPRMFGPRFGGGGGCGCGSLFFGLILLLIISNIFGSGFGGSYGGSYSNDYNSNNNSGGGSLYDQPSSVQTQTALDLAELHGALDYWIPRWQADLANNEEKSIAPGDAGFENDNNVKDVIYGKCGSQFYVFVIDKGAPTDAGGANGQGYAYTTASSPSTCHPQDYQVTDWENDGGGWWFVYLQS